MNPVSNFFKNFFENLIHVFIAIFIGLVIGGIILAVVKIFEWTIPFHPWSNTIIFGLLAALVWTVFDMLGKWLDKKF